MRPFHIFIILCLLLCSAGVDAQVVRTQPQNPAQQQQQQQQQQRLNEERLANEFFRNREFDKALEMYRKLFEETQASHHFNFYLSCLLELNELDEAERIIKQYSSQGSYRDQAEIDQGYIQLLKGQEARARRAFEKVIRDLPPDRNRVSIIANAFLTRGLHEYALRVYETAAASQKIDYPFYLESSTAYQFLGNFEMMTERLLDHANYNKDHLSLVKNRLQNLLILDVDGGVSEMMRTKLLTRAQGSPSNELFSEMLIWFALQQKDFEIAMIQAMAIDRRFGDKDQQVLELAEISLANQQYEVALDGYSHIVRKGTQGVFYIYGLKGMLKTRFLIAEENPATDESVYFGLADEINQAFNRLGFNRETYELAIVLAKVYAFHLSMKSEAIDWIERAMQLQLREMELAELKMHLADVLLLKNDVWEATLLYSQVEKAHRNDPIGHEARFRNARLRYFIGEFGWAQTHLDVLKAATSKLIANDALSLSLFIRDNLMEDTSGYSLRQFSKADLMLYQRKEESALSLLDSLAKTPIAAGMLDHILMRKAEIYARRGNATVADSLYREVFTRFPRSYVADLAVYRSALINETQLNNLEAARERFGILFDQYPASLYAAEARRKYRLIRGDTV
jgi:outer membrane protein assembly factor BamD (BamD/ComL family)